MGALPPNEFTDNPVAQTIAQPLVQPVAQPVAQTLAVSAASTASAGPPAAEMTQMVSPAFPRTPLVPYGEGGWDAATVSQTSYFRAAIFEPRTPTTRLQNVLDNIILVTHFPGKMEGGWFHRFDFHPVPHTLTLLKK
jgi:hypothetical protein